MADRIESKPGFVPLETIVYRFLDMADRGEDSYRKAYNLGIMVYREMRMDVFGQTVTALINVLANKTGKLPADYSNYIRLGIPNSGTGELAEFTRNDNLSSYDILDVNRESNTGLQTYDGSGLLTPQNMPQDLFFPYFNMGSLGVGSVNNIGNFKIDKVAGYIILDPNFAYSSFLMEYTQDANVISDNYMVDINAEQAILDGIIWKWNWLRKDIPVSEKQIQRAEYYNQKRLARQRMNPLTLQDINDSGRRGIKSAPKA